MPYYNIKTEAPSVKPIELPAPLSQQSKKGDDFVRRLYSGFEGESYVTGCLFGMGLEAFKLPGDFGFDLMVTNQFERQSRKTLDRIIKPPYVVQVKSCRKSVGDFHPGSNGRPEVTAKYLIKDDDIELLLKTENSFLALVLFMRNSAEHLQRTAMHFWLSSAHLKLIHSKGFFYPCPTKVNHSFLKVLFRQLPTQKLSTLTDYLMKKSWLTKEGKEHLEKTLVPEINLNWDASEYISLIRKSKNGNEDKAPQPLDRALTDFSKMGTNVTLNLN